MWKPIEQYPRDKDGKHGPLVLARDADGRHYLVILARGDFHICPGVPIYYGENQCGFMTANHCTEYTEIPE